MNLLVVSPVIPPAPSGQATVLGRLLADWDGRVHFATSDADALRAPNVTVLRPTRFHVSPRFPRPIGPVVAVLLTIWNLIRRTSEVTWIARRAGVDLIVACTAGPIDVPAACVAARLARRPCVPYLFDDPVYQWPPGWTRRFARLLEPVWSRMVQCAIAPNEAMAAEFNSRTGRDVHLVRNPVPDEVVDEVDVPDDIELSAPLRLLYTGAVYAAQGDALGDVTDALDRTPIECELHIYSSQSSGELADPLPTSHRLHWHEHVSAQESLRLQRHADVLVLPLAFRSRIGEVLRTSAPGKLGEYLASGRPILVHAPDDTWLHRFVEERSCAVVTAGPGADHVAEAIHRIHADAELRKAIVGAARRVAEEFRVSTSRRRFREALLDGHQRDHR